MCGNLQPVPKAVFIFNTKTEANANANQNEEIIMSLQKLPPTRVHGCIPTMFPHHAHWLPLATTSFHPPPLPAPFLIFLFIPTTIPNFVFLFVFRVFVCFASPRSFDQ